MKTKLDLIEKRETVEREATFEDDIQGLPSIAPPPPEENTVYAPVYITLALMQWYPWLHSDPSAAGLYDKHDPEKS